jgi:tetratricopeptide (TPR) repeat protein
MNKTRFNLLATTVFFLLGATAVCAQLPSGVATRQSDPLSHDPRKPNTYDLEKELRNAKIGRELESALKEGNDAFAAAPPRYAESERAFLRAVELEPKEARAYLGLGIVYAAQNQVDKTVGAFKKAIEVKPKFAEAHFNLGMVYFAIGKKNQASEEYRVLATLDQRLAKKLKDSMEK